MTAYDLHWFRFSGQHDQLKHYEKLLSTDERSRADRFKFTAARERFIIARGLLRMTLAGQSGTDPAALRFSYGQQGKPALPDFPTLHFNLAHSADALLLGISHGKAIGVDVERLRPIAEIARISADYFTPAEQGRIMAASDEEQQRAFLRLWTLKESFAKASGDGFSGTFSRYEIVEDSAQNPAQVAIRSLADGRLLNGWVFEEFERQLSEPEGGLYLAAICLQSPRE